MIVIPPYAFQIAYATGKPRRRASYWLKLLTPTIWLIIGYTIGRFVG